MATNENRALAVATLRPGAKFYLVAPDQVMFEDGKVVAPTEAESKTAAAALAAQMAQSVAARQKLYDRLYLPVLALLGQSLAKLTSTQLHALARLERYTGQAATFNALSRVACLPSVDHAPLVYPVTLVSDGLWLVGQDNSVAWQAFVGQT